MNYNLRVIDIGNHTPVSVFEQVYQPGVSCLLESASYHPITGRYSIIATKPDFIYKGSSIHEVKALLDKYKSDSNKELPPFCGGAVGYIGYDTIRSWENIKGRALKDIDIPDIYLLFYSKVIVFDHLLGKIFLINEDLPHGFKNEQDNSYFGSRRHFVLKDYFVSNPAPEVRRKLAHVELGIHTKFRPALSKEAFIDIVLKAKEYIAEGDIYQANLSQRLEADTDINGWDLYKNLRKINPSPFAGYMDLDGIELISCSPERLVKLEGNILQTRPIAGTHPRGNNKQEDRDLAYKLLLHPKERAEHIMLVDLERNDLGRVCEYGSVNVSELMTVETYSHVHHIVSNIIGRLKNEMDRIDIIKAVFPGGTITGCPKIRCMQIIDELEPVKRNIYTGSMGYLSYNGNIDLNIIIRTILKLNCKLYLQVGAGIVADSVPEREYSETLHKAAALLEAATVDQLSINK